VGRDGRPKTTSGTTRERAGNNTSPFTTPSTTPAFTNHFPQPSDGSLATSGSEDDEPSRASRSTVPRLSFVTRQNLDSPEDSPRSTCSTPRIQIGVKTMIRDMSRCPDNSFIQEHALRTLATLALHPTNRMPILELGGNKCCLAALRAHRMSPVVVCEAAKLIFQLAHSAEARGLMIGEGPVEELVMTLDAVLEHRIAVTSICHALKELCDPDLQRGPAADKLHLRAEDAAPKARQLLVECGGVMAACRGLARHIDDLTAAQACVGVMHAATSFPAERTCGLALGLLQQNGAKEVLVSVLQRKEVDALTAARAKTIADRLKNRPMSASTPRGLGEEDDLYESAPGTPFTPLEPGTASSGIASPGV